MVKTREPLLCDDCHNDTFPFDYYMVTDAVWEEGKGGSKVLCVACLEDRLGRQLLKADFIITPAEMVRKFLMYLDN